MRSAPPNFFKQDGFTLLEMLIVMAILSLTLSFASVRYVGRTDQTSPTQFIDELASLLSAERNRALSFGEMSDVVFDLENRSISSGSFQKNIPEYLTLKLTLGRELLLEEKKGLLRFFPDGSSVGAEVKVFYPNLPGVAQAKVNWLTGIISTEEATN